MSTKLDKVPNLSAPKDYQPEPGKTVFDRAIIAIGSPVSWLFAVATVISIVEISLRYFFNAPTIWAHETIIGLIAVCYLYGGIQCLAADKHIRIGLI